MLFQKHLDGFPCGRLARMENPTYFATAPKGMPDLLVAELESLGATNVLETRAGAQFEGSM